LDLFDRRASVSTTGCKQIKAIWNVWVFAETVDHNDYPVSVAAAFLNRW